MKMSLGVGQGRLGPPSRGPHVFFIVESENLRFRQYLGSQVCSLPLLLLFQSFTFFSLSLPAQGVSQSRMILASVLHAFGKSWTARTSPTALRAWAAGNTWNERPPIKDGLMGGSCC